MEMFNPDQCVHCYYVAQQDQSLTHVERSTTSTYERKYPVPILGEKGDKRLILNPDTAHVMEVVQKIHENYGLCPSKHVVESSDMLTPDTRCPCPDVMIYGKCECGLFVETDLIPLINKEVYNGSEGETDTGR